MELSSSRENFLTANPRGRIHDPLAENIFKLPFSISVEGREERKLASIRSATLKTTKK
jgi:hypothetical protein